MEGIQGLNALLTTLNTVKDRGVRKAARAGVRAGMRPLVSAMRSAVNASPASTALKRAARKTIGSRLLRSKAAGESAKAGFSVGKRGKAPKGKSRGVGISKSNVHWFVFGTAERVQSGGHWTGQVDDVLGGLVGPAAQKASAAMLAAARTRVQQVLAQEARRARKK
ncbi:MAG: hypothetical protein ACOY3P_07015 [Planctomycetota bacterium]